MSKPLLRRLITPLLGAFLAFALSGWAWADPPSRVARLSYVSGGASFSPGGEREWGRAVINRPMVTGDRLWVERGARAELQLGAAAIRVGGATSLTLLNLDDRTAQLQLNQGTLNIRVRRLDRGQVYEVATPTVAFTIRKPGNYRIQVDANGDATTVTVRSGLGEVYGDGRAFITAEKRTYHFYDSGLRDYEIQAATRLDEFDRWASERDRRWDSSPSRRYVSQELIGYDDLDQHGSWRKVPEYGNVWTPNRVPAGWAPYRDGHWAWVAPWGWTWVDEAPWGFAPSHYGRWAYVGQSWAWVPGPANTRPVYAPALVAFVGSSGGSGTVGWFPLGPRDVYRPSYNVSSEYFTIVNTSNTVINRTVVTNYYGNQNPSNVTYANQQVAGAVVAVLAATFSQSRPVAREIVRVTTETVARAPVTAVAPVAPVQASVVGPAAGPAARPPVNVLNRSVVAQVAPPPPPVPFAAKQSALTANAGKPLDTAAVAALKPAAAASAPAVKVVEAAKPVAPPPAPPASSGRAAGRAAEAQSAAPPGSVPAAPATVASRPAPAAPAAPAARASQPAPVTAAPAAGTASAGDRFRPQADEERGRRGPASGPRARDDSRPPLAAPAAAPAPLAPAAPPAQSASPAPAAPPTAVAPRPAAPPAAVKPSAPVAPPEAAVPPAPATPPAATRPSVAPPAAAVAPAPARAPAVVPPAPPPAVLPQVASPPAPRASAPAAAAAPAARPPVTAASAAEAGGDQRGRAKPVEASASARREAASERRRQRDEEQRKP